MSALSAAALPHRPGIGLRLLLLAVCMAALLLASEKRGDWRLALQPAPPVFISLSGEHYRVPQEGLETLRLSSALRVAEGETEAREIVHAHVHQQVGQLFDDLSLRLPEFADWYYSLRGEYGRLSMLLLEKVNLVDGSYVARRAQQLVFESAGFEERLDVLQLQADHRLLERAQATRSDLLEELVALLARNREPTAPLTQERSLSLDAWVDRLSVGGSPDFSSRVSLSSAAGIGAGAGSLLWRAAGRRTAAHAARTAAARGAGRGLARAGAAAGGGAALCAPTGPGALGCAAIAGAAGWVGTDWLLLRLDEAFNRDDLIAALQEGLDAMQAELATTLIAAYDEVVDRQYGALRADIERTFVPARSTTGR